jgi:hypothetical protein
VAKSDYRSRADHVHAARTPAHTFPVLLAARPWETLRIVASRERFSKRDEQIVAETDALRAEVAGLLDAGQADRASAIATAALYERVGEFWMWLKDSR